MDNDEHKKAWNRPNLNEWGKNRGSVSISINSFIKIFFKKIQSI